LLGLLCLSKTGEQEHKRNYQDYRSLYFHHITSGREVGPSNEIIAALQESSMPVKSTKAHLLFFVFVGVHGVKTS
jgi:hypothetical protein